MAPTLVVQKYGGSSLHNEAAISQVADQIVACLQGNRRLVIVVSAMGRTTEELMHKAARVAAHPPPRELDLLLTAGERISMALLAMAICERGHRAMSLTGSQSGIVTDERHADARIVEVRPQRLLAGLQDNEVVIVAGYQGVSRTREVTTLGRGGSDTTAVALGAALGAEAVEILSDVEGVFRADPRLCPQAQLLAHIDYAPMRRLTGLGARIVKAEAISYAARAGITLTAAHALRQGAHTTIGPEPGQADPLGREPMHGRGGALALADVARVAWLCGPTPLQPALRAQIMRRAGALTGRVLLVVDAGVAIDWTYALVDAHTRLAAELQPLGVEVHAASCLSLVGDLLLDDTLATAQLRLRDAGIEPLAHVCLPTSLSFVVPPAAYVRAAQLLLALI